MNSDPCPKCGWPRFSGPTYVSSVIDAPYHQEALMYSCQSCGYKKYEATKDKEKGLNMNQLIVDFIAKKTTTKEQEK